jgi:hypothetical protein
MPRKTQRIPEGQRKRPHVRLTLDPRAAQILRDLPPRTASEYVSQLILDDHSEHTR